MRSPVEIADKIEELCWLAYDQPSQDSVDRVTGELDAIHWLLGHTPVAPYIEQGEASYKSGVRFQWNGTEYVKTVVPNA